MLSLSSLLIMQMDTIHSHFGRGYGGAEREKPHPQRMITKQYKRSMTKLPFYTPESTPVPSSGFLDSFELCLSFPNLKGDRLLDCRSELCLHV